MRVRWPKGVERIDVAPNDTIGDVVDKMAKKHGLSAKNVGLIQESENTMRDRKIKLSQLKITNGEIFRLELPTDNKKKDTKPLVPEPVPNDVKRFRAEWGENAVSVSEITKRHIVIEQQKECKTKRILLPPEDCERVSHIVKELHFTTTRVFFLYGTCPSESAVRVHAVALPPQTFGSAGLKVSEKELGVAEQLAASLNLKFVGVIITNDTKEPPISCESMLTMVDLAKKAGDCFTIVAAIPDSGLCHFEAFQFSNQFLELASRNFFIGIGEKGLKPKENVILYTKEMDEIDPSYFLVNVAIKTRASWFPRCRFPFQALYPSCADFAEAVNRDFEVPNFVRLLDFNLLIFLESKFGGLEDVEMIAKLLVEKKGLPFQVIKRIDELLNLGASSA